MWIKYIEDTIRSNIQEKIISKSLNFRNVMTEFGRIKHEALNKVSIQFQFLNESKSFEKRKILFQHSLMQKKWVTRKFIKIFAENLSKI